MVKIVSNHNKQDIIYSYTLGQTFPDVQGKLLSVEVSGKELTALMQKKEIPISSEGTLYLTWHGKQAGGILKIIREILPDKTS